MKLTCNGTDLADALAKVIKALPVKKTQPILEGVKLSAQGDTLTVYATDYDFAISKQMKADVRMEGDVLVPGKLLNDLARKLASEDSIELSDITDDNLTIAYADSSTFLKTMSLAEYPPQKEYDYDVTLSLLQKDFRDMINKTIFSAATDGARPILKGCLLEVSDDEMRCVALDGYRLAICRKKLARSYDHFQAIVPAKSLMEISKLLDRDEEVVNLHLSASRLMVDLGDTRVSASLLNGAFINYKNTVPSELEITVTVNKQQLEDAIERASILSRYEKSNLIRLEIKEGKMTIVSTSELGESKEVISIFSKGKDITIGFNARYVSDCLKAIDDEFVILRMNSATAPCVFTPVEGDDYLYLILPIRIVR